MKAKVPPPSGIKALVTSTVAFSKDAASTTWGVCTLVGSTTYNAGTAVGDAIIPAVSKAADAVGPVCSAVGDAAGSVCATVGDTVVPFVKSKVGSAATAGNALLVAHPATSTATIFVATTLAYVYGKKYFK